MEFLNDNKKRILVDFAKFVVNELKIKNAPEIRIKSSREGLKTMANYNYSKPEKIINVYGNNRALVDIMRSFSHELTHHKQWEDGRLEVKPPDIGHEIEDEANAKAGQFIKMYALKNKEIYDY